jgi:hypothetical protein
MTVGSRPKLALLALVAAAASSMTAVAAPAALMPHRATYNISLIDARAGAGVSELSGRMVYELTGSECAGFTQTMRFVTRTTNQEGNVSLSDLRSLSWEDGSGDRFRFNSSQYRNDALAEQTVGEAVRRKRPSEIRVELTKPKRKVTRISADAMFPIQHSRNLLQAARDGRKLFATDLFDASESGEKVYATNAFIGARLEAGYNKSLDRVPGSDSLDTLPAWPVAMSYFEKGTEKTDAVPAYELAFVFFDNGVSRRIRIDYGDFSIRGDLKELVMLDAAKCDPATNKK